MSVDARYARGRAEQMLAECLDSIATTAAVSLDSKFLSLFRLFRNAARSASLKAKRDNGIHTRGAARGYIARHQRGHQEHQ